MSIKNNSSITKTFSERELCNSQKNLWFSAQTNENANTSYNVLFAFKLTGNLDEHLFQLALNKILNKHDALRSRVKNIDGIPTSYIDSSDEVNFKLDIIDISKSSSTYKKIKEIINNEATKPFSLEYGPLIKGVLMKEDKNIYTFLLKIHHIITDGWSLDLMFKEICYFYNSLSTRKTDYKQPRLSYSDFCEQQNKSYNHSNLANLKKYWKNNLLNAPSYIPIPSDFRRPKTQYHRGAFVGYCFSKKLTKKLKSLSANNNVSLFVTMLSAWAILIAKLSGEDDIIVGTAVANREHKETQELIGLFASILPIRINVDKHLSVSKLLSNTKNTLKQGLEHKELSLDQIIKLAQPTRSHQYNPLFQTCFSWPIEINDVPRLNNIRFAPTKHVLEKFSATSANFNDKDQVSRKRAYTLSILGTPNVNSITKFDLAPLFWESGDQIIGSIEYSCELYKKNTIERNLKYWINILESMVENDQQNIKKIQILENSELQQILRNWNNTSRVFNKTSLVHEIFEAQVTKTPKLIAVKQGKFELTYEDLNQQANQLAQYLRLLNVQTNDRIAISVDKSSYMLIGLLAIMKAGAAFVPLDSSFPKSRLDFMLKDSDAKAIIVDNYSRTLFANKQNSPPSINIQSESSEWSLLSRANYPKPPIDLERNNEVYTVYTSGSTGQPKGVRITHQNLTNFIFWVINYFKLEKGQLTSSVAGFSFDALGIEIWPALSSGLTISLPSKDELHNPEQLLNWWKKQPLDISFLPTPLAEMAIIQNWINPRLKHLLVGGDQLRQLPQQSNDLVITNLYGPSEATIVSTAANLSSVSNSIHIGKPIANTKVYVLDSALNPVPIGVTGELYICGAGLALGYLNQEELTRKSFISNPFDKTPNSRLYKTGDLVCWRDDGNLEYIGRNDFQVKLRGFRVELGEIESCLLEHSSIQSAVVLLNEDSSKNQFLVAYCIPHPRNNEDPFSTTDLRQYLMKKIPEFMVPAAFVELKEFPLTPNGKLDRQKLKSIKVYTIDKQNYEAPGGEIESTIAEIWSKLLIKDQVSRYDNFFDIGGHSLLAVQVISRLRQALNIEVTIDDLFAHPVLSSFAALIDSTKQHTSSLITPVSRDQSIPLSFAQQRLWFLSQIGPQVSRAYHMRFDLKLVGQLNISALRQALDGIVRRHESLRTTFKVLESEPIQIIHDRKTITMLEHDLTDQINASTILKQLTLEEINTPFDLSIGPLIRARLIKLKRDEYHLLITQHHILSDGWSYGVLTNELSQLYTAFLEGSPSPLAPLTIQYADFTYWQRHAVAGRVLQQQSDYWVSQLSEAPTQLELPTDYPRPLEQSYAGDLVQFELDRTLTQSIRALCQNHNATMFMILLSSWAILLSRLSGQKDIVIGTPTANRNHQELEQLIGFFVNALALRIDLSGQPSVKELIERVRKISLQALRNQDIPFEQVVELIQPERSLSHNPLFQVAFAWQNAPAPDLELKDLTISQLPRTDHSTSIFDLSLHLWDGDNGITGCLEYSTDLYNKDTIGRFLNCWKSLLMAMASDPHQTIEKLPLMNKEAIQQITIDWNQTNIHYRQAMVHELFEETALSHGQLIAIKQGELELTYAELNQQANQLARHLSTFDCKPDDKIALCMERSPTFIIGLLAILKVGAAYIPLDPAHPQKRLKFLLQDSQPSLLLVDSQTKSLIEDSKLATINLQTDTHHWSQLSTENFVINSPDYSVNQLAYVIYTSGSTGNPKGVLIEHRNLSELVHWHCQKFQLKAKQQSSCIAGIGFDACAWEIWPAICTGATLCIPTEIESRNPDLLLKWWQSQSLDISFLPTSLAELAFQQNLIPRQLKQLLVGGDRLKKLPNKEHTFHLHNNYGPTESTVVATSGEIIYQHMNDDSIHIGQPVTNTQVYVLDSELQAVPVGVTGELYIGGTGLARGYFNQEELTRQSFIPNPFDESGQSRLYKTGDLVSWRPDGNLNYIGRNDFQVKLRGFRIELGEIENKLIEHSFVKDVVVSCDSTTKNKQLIAYIALNDKDHLDLETDIQSEQIAKWQSLYNTTYAQTEDLETSEDFVGWNSSFTGLPIPEIEMREWRDNTVKRIHSMQPNSLLEIGCGTGLLLFQIAPYCSEYVACDFSAETIQRLSHKVAQQNLNQVKLLHREANDLADLPENRFDTIVINSVIQYFPTVEYLFDVIEKALTLLSPSGKLFVGDVRNFDLFETFHTAIQFFRANPDSKLQSLVNQSKQAFENEKELLISPEFFLSLKARLSAVNLVRVLPKLAYHQNELTHYRYDVMIEKQTVDNSSEYTQIDWQQDHYSTEQLTNQLQKGLTAPLLLVNIINPRVARNLASTQLLLHTEWSSSLTLNELESLVNQQTKEDKLLDPQKLADLCQQHGYKLELSWLRTQGPETYHAIIGQSDFSSFPLSLINSLPQTIKSPYANEPLKLSANIEVITHLKTSLQQVLPEYMIPTQWMVLDELPLTPNGKVNRKALPKLNTMSHQADHVAPASDEEIQLAKIWCDLLSLDKVSTYNNFFEIGGQSLLAVQVISRLRQILDIEVTLNDLFANPVLSDFAKIISRAQQDVLPPITRISRQQLIPLSFAQQRLWFLTQMGEHASRAYHQPIGFRLEGHLNPNALKRALDQIVIRHESLRTSISLEKDMPVQEINDNHSFTLVEHDLTTENEKQTIVEQLVEAEASAAFDLRSGPLIRGRLIKTTPTENILLITLHHILSDGWSISVLVKELSELYVAYQQNKPNPLKTLQVQYADFSHWQRQCLAGDLLSKQAEYWRQLLTGAPFLLDLPTDFQRPDEQSFAGDLIEFQLSPTLSQGVRQLSQKHNTTMFMTLLASWSILISRLSNQQDLIIGTPTANRNRNELESLIGFFVNTLALRIDLTGKPSVDTLLARVKSLSLQALQHQDIPFEQVVELVQPERSLSYNPLFQVAFAWQNAPADSLELKDLTIKELPRLDHTTAIFDLSMHLWDGEQYISGCLEYSTDLFEKDTIERYLGYWKNLLEAMVSNDQQRIDKLPLMNQAELHKVLIEWNNTDADFNNEKCVHELFEAQVIKNQNAIAIKQGNIEISYGELNYQANQLARHLRTLDIQPDSLIALSAERGPAMIIGILATLKAGAAYVALDPTYPIGRLKYMLDDSSPIALLVDSNTKKLFNSKLFHKPIIDIQNDKKKWKSASKQNISREETGIQVKHLAYVIYTSGSTGRPKGVLVEHANVNNFIFAMNRRFKVQVGDRFLQFSSFSFDMFVFELTLSITNGATICIADNNHPLVGENLIDIIKQNRITHAVMTPSVMNSIQSKKDLASLEYLMLGGESLTSKLANYWGKDRNLFNGYGPAEATICMTTHLQKTSDNFRAPPIGKPISNTKAFVLDDNLKPVPIGVSGELYIQGKSVTRGYLDRPSLNRSRFIDVKISGMQKMRLYKTGDIVRWTKIGNLEYVGRNDFQVKLRGYRIELTEVETILLNHKEIESCIVLVREDSPGDKQIVAYYVAIEATNKNILPAKLKKFLQSSLPAHMVPSAYVSLEALPLTPNGKVAKELLRAPDISSYAQKNYEAPVGELEGLIASHCCEILTKKQIGRHDNFFDLGGNSLSIIQLQNRLKKDGINVTTIELFKFPSIELLASHIVANKNQSINDEMPILLKEGNEGSPILFFVHDGSGMLAYANAIAKNINIDAQIYGLPPIKDEDNVFLSIEKLATRLKKMIEQIQPDGDYNILGWSFGGLLAYETAAQLVKCGNKVSFVGLFDTYYFGGNKGFQKSVRDEKTHLLTLLELEAYGNKSLQHAMTDIRKDIDKLELHDIVDRANELKHSFMPAHLKDIEIEELSGYLAQQRAYYCASLEYRTKSEVEELHLFKANEVMIKKDFGQQLGWSKSEAKEVNVINIEGTHYTMMTEPYIHELTKSLQKALTKE